MSATERVALAFLRDHPEDAAKLLERASPADVAAVLASVPADDGAEVLRSLGPTAAHDSAAALSDDALTVIIEKLPLDAAGSVLRRMGVDRRAVLLAALDQERRERLDAALTFPDNSAGSLADPVVLALPDDITVGDAQKAVRTAHPTTPDVYVVTRERVLVGVLSIQDLMAARPKEPLQAVMLPNPVRLDAGADLATVAVHPAWREFDALPVVDGAGRLVGGIQHRAVRRLNPDRGGPMIAALVGLSELYWASLSGIIASFSPPKPATTGGPSAGGNNVT